MFLKKISSVICSVVIAVTSLILPVSSEMRTDEGMRNISTMQLVRDMGIGINLGNTNRAETGYLNGETVL